ncbi:hemin uptake protein HemP [Hydrogenophaga palleronii]|uniref:Hemin uptake protein HemP n=1 Tax=Hydrogenophaga palleronii TaxID=65655 RepID=A0ABU1WJ68_9BURK|nr:hemin uptake protein HemP [Hydrogenophaga palleronii]MDR7149325.1 hemin uptake protein HemP [Hydrogenophaga palleronii]
MKTPQPAADIDPRKPSWAREMSPTEPSEVSQVLHSASLLRGQKTVAIEHNGALYRLQSTRAGKLILTK